MVEARAILKFASEKYTVTLIQRSHGRRTPDFRATRGTQTSLVEAKYIRPPDKVGEYLSRWWQAQTEVAEQHPLGLLPHLRFEWQPLQSRDELSQYEIETLMDFFTEVLEEPERFRDITLGRLVVRYIPNRKLPIPTQPLTILAAKSEAHREGLFDKIRRDLDDAVDQLGAVLEGQERAIFLALNLSPDIPFLWPDRFNERLEALQQEFLVDGTKVLVEKVGYL